MGPQQSKFSLSMFICVHLRLKTLNVQIISGLPGHVPAFPLAGMSQQSVVTQHRYRWVVPCFQRRS